MTPGQQWLRGQRRAKAICKELCIDPAEPGASYAIGPFAILTVDERPWIAGAVGIWRAFKPRDWEPDDITDVILWSPRTGELRLLDDDGPALILPANPEPRLTVYGEGLAFFRAWADRRAATFASVRTAFANHRVAGVEPHDSDIPGALAIGDLAKLPWMQANASVLVAGPGIDGRRLNAAVIRSARLPRVEMAA